MPRLLANLVGLALAALLALPASSGSEVLCIGEDGHVRLEEAARADCHERERALLGELARALRTGALATARLAAPRSGGGDCGPCTDLSVESLLTAAAGTGLAAELGPPVPAFFASRESPAPRLAARRPAPKRSLERPTRRLHALGVLRC